MRGVWNESSVNSERGLFKLYFVCSCGSNGVLVFGCFPFDLSPPNCTRLESTLRRVLLCRQAEEARARNENQYSE